MRREPRLSPIAPIAMLAIALSLASACNSPSLKGPREQSTPPAVDRATASGVVLAQYLELLQKLVQSAPAVQAETFSAVEHEYDVAPTPGHQLRFALVLASPGHAATDLS